MYFHQAFFQVHDKICVNSLLSSIGYRKNIVWEKYLDPLKRLVVSVRRIPGSFYLVLASPEPNTFPLPSDRIYTEVKTLVVSGLKLENFQLIISKSNSHRPAWLEKLQSFGLDPLAGTPLEGKEVEIPGNEVRISIFEYGGFWTARITSVRTPRVYKLGTGDPVSPETVFKAVNWLNAMVA